MSSRSLAALAALMWCATPAFAGLFSATGPIIAIMAGDLYVGEAEGNIDGSGTLAIQSRMDPLLTCRGQFAKNGDDSGSGTLECKDGSTATFQYRRLSLLRGHGSGDYSRGTMTFTYGLSALDSAPYLKLPPGKSLRLIGKDLNLVELKQPFQTLSPLSHLIAPATETAPDILLSNATQLVTENLNEDKGILTKDSPTISELLESSILPLFDFPRMTQLALARTWRIASPTQQADLIREFRALLVHTYTLALTSYGRQAILYKPLRMAANDSEVTVRSTVKQPGSERLSIDYDMEKTAVGWKIFDVKIAGVSLMTTYRSSFAETVLESGIDGLIKTIASKNRLADAGINTGDTGKRHILLMYSLIPSIIGGRR